MNARTCAKIAAFYALGGLPPVPRLVRAHRGPAAILLYHQVYDHPDDASRGHPNAINVVSPARFDEQMRALRDHFEPCALDDLYRRVQARGPDAPAPDRLPVAVTFDDGHLDNLEVALPILERYRVPATFYITTGFMDGTASPWWFELWDLLAARQSVTLADPPGAWSLATPAARLHGYRAIAARLLRLPLDGQAAILAALRAPAPPAAARPRFIDAERLRAFARHPLVTIGAHTRRHPALAAESEAAVRAELIGARQELEALLGRPVVHLAYPFGSPETTGEREYRLAAACGYATAVTTRPACLVPGAWHALPRHPVREVHTAAHLRVKLSGWNARWQQDA